MRIHNSDLEATQITVSRGFEAVVCDGHEMIINPAAVHITRDPITGEMAFHVYTDDGKGNGDHILSVHVKDAC